MGWPSTCSSTRYGWPVGETPASISCAMCGCVSRARMVPSRLKRSLAGAADQRDVQQLDRRLPLEAAVAALGEPHAAHAALADRRRRACRRRPSGRPAERRLRGSSGRGCSRKPLVQRACGARRAAPADRRRAPGRRARSAASQRRAVLVGMLERLVEVRADARCQRSGSECRHERVRRIAGSSRRSRGAGRGGPSPSRAARSAPRRRAWRAISANEKPQKNFRSTICASAGVDVGQLVERVADLR